MTVVMSAIGGKNIGGKMPQNEFIEITNQKGEKMKMEISWESDVWVWSRTFRVILKWLEFPSIAVDRILPKGDSLGNEE